MHRALRDGQAAGRRGRGEPLGDEPEDRQLADGQQGRRGGPRDVDHTRDAVQGHRLAVEADEQPVQHADQGQLVGGERVGAADDERAQAVAAEVGRQ